MSDDGRCPICGGTGLERFLRRSNVPVHQNLIATSREAARAIGRGDLDLVVCDSCGFVHNRAFDLSRLAYGQDYDNTQSCSPYFDRYLDGLVEDLVVRRGVRECRVVEVGCGKGHFLKKLVSHPASQNLGFGFDPSYVGPATVLDGRVEFHPRFYDDSCTDVAADVVVCRHVIEHVPDPMALLRSVRAALRGSPGARVFFETPCVEWIFENAVVWDLFYEHCSLFTASSLRRAFELAGFGVDRVVHVFGGQYLWIEASPHDAIAPDRDAGTPTVRAARAYGAREAALREQWAERLRDLGNRGKIALWGAGAKGATFANIVDPECLIIDCVVDVNPNKQGRFVPGTGHPIVAPEDLGSRGARSVVLMNPNYREENLRLLSDAHVNVDLLDWSE